VSFRAKSETSPGKTPPFLVLTVMAFDTGPIFCSPAFLPGSIASNPTLMTVVHKIVHVQQAMSARPTQTEASTHALPVGLLGFGCLGFLPVDLTPRQKSLSGVIICPGYGGTAVIGELLRLGAL